MSELDPKKPERPEAQDHEPDSRVHRIGEKLHHIEDKLHNIEAKVKRSLATRIGHAVMWTVIWVIVSVVLIAAGLAWYTTTDSFQRRVGNEVVKVLEDATGGRVELKGIRFSLAHLSVEADGLVIHGLEGPGEAPYLSADKIQLRVKLFNFFQHTAGSGMASHVSLSYLRADRPQIHLIVDKDGKTNQPVPKHSTTSTTSLTDTLLDLKAKQVEVANGMALLNDRAIPFELAARDLNAQVKYISAGDKYGVTIDLNDLRTKMLKEPEAQSKLHMEAQLGRDKAEVTKLEFDSGKSSVLHATGSLNDFAKPEWQVHANGTLELRQIMVLAGVDGLEAGTVDVDINGHNCQTAPAVAQKRPPFWQRTHPRSNEKPSTTTLPPDPDCQAGYLVVGKAKVHNGAYRDVNVRLHDINGGGQLHITPTELLLTTLTGSLPGGGSAEGRLRISNWLGEVEANTPVGPTARAAVTTANTTASTLGAKAPLTAASKASSVQQSHAYLDAVVTKIPLRTILDVTTDHFGDLGFDTAVSGPVKAEWSGPAETVADTVEVQGELTFTGTGVKRAGALNNTPITGETVAHYSGRTQTVNIQRLVFQTPQSTFDASGVLGVNKGDPLTALRVDMTVHDLGEYNQLLTTLDWEANGKKGSASIPVVLHGAMQFNGTAHGIIANLDVKGHLQADNLEAQLGTAGDVLIDSLVADAEYSPYSGVAVANSTIKRGTAVLNVTGTAKPRKVTSTKGVATYLWDNGVSIDTNVQLDNAQVTDVLQIAGQQSKVPLTGTVALHAHATGELKTLGGTGELTLRNGVAYGEPYESAVAELSVQGRDLEASRVTVRMHGMQIAGSGGYDFAAEHLHGHIEGNNLQLSKFQTVRERTSNADGILSVTADANGTLTEPGLKADLKLANVIVEGQAVGEAAASLHSEGKNLFYTVKSTLVGAKLDGSGQTELAGDYATQAKLTFADLDVNKPLTIFAPGKIDAQSSLGGTVTVSGPLKTPQSLNGKAEFNDFDVKLQGIELKSAEPLQLSLSNGLVHLDQLHITGQDTDLHASGTAQIFGPGAVGGKGGKLDAKATGTLSMALLHTFDADILASGKLEFSVAAGGQVMNPQLTGKVQFDAVNISIDGVPNGLSNMNGTLNFNQDFLQVQSLTATTGGGQMKIGGSIRYRNGVYADLTATGDVVRVRYYGLSATANSNFRLQGSLQSALLSGNILLTRFGIGQDVDFAAFAGMGGVAAPPDPNAAANKIRLDVRVTSSPQLDFLNSYAKLSGTVDLNIRGTMAVPAVLGRIQITDGSATFAGTKYQLQRGDIYFTNPVRIDPTIDLEATARVESYDVTVGLHGTTTSLKPTYRSEPPLTEADIFNLLALGRTQEEAQLYQEQQVQQGTDPTTSALLGGALNATVSSRVEKLFGVGSVKIDPAFVGTLGGSAARITVQQQLSRQLTATYATNVNTSAQQLLQLQYDLNRNMSIVATRDETGVFSVVYKLRKRYR